MNDKERNELAADIARRVRTFIVQYIPDKLMDAIADTHYTVSLYANQDSILGSYARWEINKIANRIEITIIASNGERVVNFRFDKESVYENALTQIAPFTVPG